MRKVISFLAAGCVMLASVSAYGAWAEWNFSEGFNESGQVAPEGASDMDSLMYFYPDITTAFSISDGGLTCTQTGPSDYLRLDIDDLAANGGGGYVNEYTMIFDLKIPSLNWFPVYNTGYNNYNAADLWVRGDGAVGSGDYSDPAITEGEWARLTVVRRAAGPDWVRDIYVNGALLMGDFHAEGSDGNSSLYTDEQQPEGQFTILSDADEWTYAGCDLQNFAFADWGMSAEDVAGYGAYDGDPIGIPEPTTLALLCLGGVALLRKRNS
jgi:hypothetical protein